MTNNFEIIQYTGQSNGLDMKMFSLQSMYKNSDLDLHASNIVPASDTFFSSDDYLHFILKSQQSRHIYGPDTNIFNRRLCTKFTCKLCPLPLI